MNPTDFFFLHFTDLKVETDRERSSSIWGLTHQIACSELYKSQEPEREPTFATRVAGTQLLHSASAPRVQSWDSNQDCLIQDAGVPGTYLLHQTLTSASPFIYLNLLNVFKIISNGRGERDSTPICGFTLNAHNGSLAGAEAGSQELNWGLPHGWKQSNYLSHYCCHWRSAFTGSWSQELELPSIGHRYSKVDSRCLIC